MIEVNGGIVGVSDRAVFFSTQKNLGPQALATLGKKEKAQLGEHGGRLIEKDKVASVHAAKDARFTTVITAKGLGDDIGVHALSEAAQQRIVDRALVGKRPARLNRCSRGSCSAWANPFCWPSPRWCSPACSTSPFRR
ncbi:MAG: hypothetical protein V4679_09060 [Pseudomonadota bacterium]